uniref:PYD and CARD domain containing n=1 Tax=Mastacembelus armatus TaxID=205130 RepID=A0A7N9ARI7_9TELE
MPYKTVKAALTDMFEDLSDQDFSRFYHKLLDRRIEPRIRRQRIEDKDRLDIADVMISTFTEAKVVHVVVEILRDIGCNQEAADLRAVAIRFRVPVVAASPEPGASRTKPWMLLGCHGKHFVDRHKVELIRRVSNIGPILDDLLDEDVIQQEVYEQIRALPTTQDKIRELYSGPLKASEACKDIFYESLQIHEKFLIDDLKDK